MLLIVLLYISFIIIPYIPVISVLSGLVVPSFSFSYLTTCQCYDVTINRVLLLAYLPVSLLTIAISTSQAQRLVLSKYT